MQPKVDETEPIFQPDLPMRRKPIAVALNTEPQNFVTQWFQDVIFWDALLENRVKRIGRLANSIDAVI